MRHQNKSSPHVFLIDAILFQNLQRLQIIQIFDSEFPLSNSEAQNKGWQECTTVERRKTRITRQGIINLLYIGKVAGAVSQCQCFRIIPYKTLTSVRSGDTEGIEQKLIGGRAFANPHMIKFVYCSNCSPFTMMYFP